MIALFIVSGWVVDHFPRKYILGVCLGLQALLMAGLALSMNAETFDKNTIYILIFLQGCCSAFYRPAQQALLPNLVSKEFLSKAVALASVCLNVSTTAGPFLAGLCIAWVDKTTYWLLCGITGAAAVTVLLLPKIAHIKPLNRDIKQVLGGIQFIKDNPVVLGSISLDLFIVMLGSVVALLPVYAVDILKVGPDALGLLRAAPALGAVAMGILLARLPPMRRSGHYLFIALAVFAFSILTFAVSQWLWLSLLALFIYGASDMISMNIRTTLVQIATPDHLRGRVSAVNAIFIVSSNGLGDFRAGALATATSPLFTTVLGGVAALAITVFGFIGFPSIRKLDKLSDAERKENQE